MGCSPLFRWVATPYLDGFLPPISMGCNPYLDGLQSLFGWVAIPYLDGLQPPNWMGCNPLFGWVAIP